MIPPGGRSFWEKLLNFAPFDPILTHKSAKNAPRTLKPALIAASALKNTSPAFWGQGLFRILQHSPVGCKNFNI